MPKLTRELYARRLSEIDRGLAEADAEFEKACSDTFLTGDETAQRAALDRKRILESQREALLAAGRAERARELREEVEQTVRAWEDDADEIAKIVTAAREEVEAQIEPFIPVLQAMRSKYSAVHSEVMARLRSHRIPSQGPGSRHFGTMNPVFSFNRELRLHADAAGAVTELLGAFRIMESAAEDAMRFLKPQIPEYLEEAA